MIETERLILHPLNPNQLKLWLNDIQSLERELNIKYDAEPLEGIFLEIVNGQLEVVLKNDNDYLYHSFWLLIKKENRLVVGSCDFKNIPNENGEVEIGYGLGEAHEHNGYMTEAIKAFCEWGLKQNGIKTIIAETDSDNIPSQNVLVRNGFEKYNETSSSIWWRIK